jgi:hypothetical protein
MAEPVYLTKQDYYDFSGIDLAIELSGTNTDNPSDVVDIFLKRIEDWCLSYLSSQYNILPTSDEWDLTQFKKGLLHQIDYIRLNGEVSVRAANNIKLLAPNAYREWKIGGMVNTALPRQRDLVQWV